MSGDADFGLGGRQFCALSVSGKCNELPLRRIFACFIYVLQQVLGLSLLAIRIEREKQDVSTDELDKFWNHLSLLSIFYCLLNY